MQIVTRICCQHASPVWHGIGREVTLMSCRDCRKKAPGKKLGKATSSALNRFQFHRLMTHQATGKLHRVGWMGICKAPNTKNCGGSFCGCCRAPKDLWAENVLREVLRSVHQMIARENTHKPVVGCEVDGQFKIFKFIALSFISLRCEKCTSSCYDIQDARNCCFSIAQFCSRQSKVHDDWGGRLKAIVVWNRCVWITQETSTLVSIN